MEDVQEDADIIEFTRPGDEAFNANDGVGISSAKDVTLRMKQVPFKEKVEKWLMTCDRLHAKKNLKDSETVIREKTVVKEIIEETESLQSVDTEQYIKSNRTRTTTKITTTTIKKYYSLVGVGKTNNNDENYLDDRRPIPAIRKMSTNEEEENSCRVTRNSLRKPNNKSISNKEDTKTNRIKRIHQSRHGSESDDAQIVDKPNRKVGKCHLASNAQIIEEYNDNGNISAGTSEASDAQRKSKRIKVTKKRNQRSMRGCRVKLTTLNNCVNLISDSLATEPKESARKKGISKAKFKTGCKQNAGGKNSKHTNHVSSDSEEEILLTSYRTYPQLKNLKKF